MKLMMNTWTHLTERRLTQIYVDKMAVTWTCTPINLHAVQLTDQFLDALLVVNRSQTKVQGDRGRMQRSMQY
ncbi:hypothetical protein R3I94_013038 [Phoxinus phoxinus]